MKKLLISALTVIVLATSLASANSKITVRVNNQPIDLKDAAAFVDKSNRTLVPLRFIADNLNATTDWEKESQTATVTQGDKVIKLCIPCKKLSINGEETSTDSYGLIKNNRTYVPLRLIAEAFGAKVQYKNQVVDINTDGSIPDQKEEELKTPDSSKMKQLDSSLLSEKILNIRTEGTTLYDGAGWDWNVIQSPTGKANNEGFAVRYTNAAPRLHALITSDGKWIDPYITTNLGAIFQGNYIGVEFDKAYFIATEYYNGEKENIIKDVDYLVDIPNFKVEKRG